MSTPRLPRQGWAYGYQSAYWVALGLGVLIMAAAWNWFALSYFEEMTEQGKALAAGTTMEGSGAALGIPPLVFAHGLGLITLGLLATKGLGRSWRALAYAAGGVAAAASVLGIFAAQLVWQGQLFEMGATARTLIQP